jgi:hypothetical protein
MVTSALSHRCVTRSGSQRRTYIDGGEHGYWAATVRPIPSPKLVYTNDKPERPKARVAPPSGRDARRRQENSVRGQPVP